MSQNKEISNKTLSLIDANLGTISIAVNFDQDIHTSNGIQTVLQNAKIASVELMEQPIIKDNVGSSEGELMIQKAGEVIFEIDNNGDFYLSDKDAQLYEINDMGELIFNQTL